MNKTDKTDPAQHSCIKTVASLFQNSLIKSLKMISKTVPGKGSRNVIVLVTLFVLEFPLKRCQK